MTNGRKFRFAPTNERVDRYRPGWRNPELPSLLREYFGTFPGFPGRPDESPRALCGGSKISDALDKSLLEMAAFLDERHFYADSEAKWCAIEGYQEALAEVAADLSSDDRVTFTDRHMKPAIRHAENEYTQDDYSPAADFFVPLWFDLKSLWARDMLTRFKGYRDTQREKSREAVTARWGNRETVSNIIASLAAHRDELGDPTPARDLWPLLHAALDEAGLSPVQDDDRTTWDGSRDGMTLRTFTNRISKTRTG